VQGVKQSARARGADGVKKEGDGIKKEGDGIKKEGDGVKKEKDGIKKEGDGVKKEKDGIKKEKDGVRKEGDGVKKEGDGAKKDSDGASKQSDVKKESEADSLQHHRSDTKGKKEREPSSNPDKSDAGHALEDHQIKSKIGICEVSGGITAARNADEASSSTCAAESGAVSADHVSIACMWLFEHVFVSVVFMYPGCCCQSISSLVCVLV
jgi:hypothetical protein